MILNYKYKKLEKEEIEDGEYKLSDFDTFKNEIVGELKNAKYNDLEDMVYGMQLHMMRLLVF